MKIIGASSEASNASQENFGMTAEKRFYKQKDFADYIGVDRHSLKNWKKSGKLLPFVDEVGKNYYTEEQAVSFLKQEYGEKILRGEDWVDLSNIKRDRIRDRYDWKTAAKEGKTIDFYYRGKLGQLKILDCNNNKLSIEIEGRTDTIQVPALISIQMDKITGYFTFEYKYAIGEVVIEGNTDITIIEQTRTDNGKARAYRYVCNKCKQENIISEYNISGSGCCPVCNGGKIVAGINDIATTDPWMIPYFADESDTTKYSYGSQETPQFVCPECGRLREKNITIDTLHRTRSIACVCGDGYSFPNKFMFAILEQLQDKDLIRDFVKEFNDDWTKGRKYDFYVRLINNTEILIEMDGRLGHGQNVIGDVTPEDTLYIDRMKDNQALKHGFSVIRVDASYSKLEYLRKSVLTSLNSYFNLEEMDWLAAEKFALSNLTKKVCLYYESHKPMTTKELGDYFHMSQTTAYSYVKRGEKFGWCTYDWDYYHQRRTAYQKVEHNERLIRVVRICKYYEKHRPILAINIAERFNINISTVLSYLEQGTKYGFTPYDKEYAAKCNQEQIRSIAGNPRKVGVYCFSLEKKYIKRYESMAAAGREHGVSSQAIKRCCEKKGTSAGYIFRTEADCEIPVPYDIRN